MSHVLHLFGLYLGAGTLALLPSVDHRRIDPGYFRLMAAVAAGGLLVAALSLPGWMAAAVPLTRLALTGTLAFAVCYGALVLAGRVRLARQLAGAAAIPLVICVVAEALAHARHPGAVHATPAILAALATSAGTLASVNLSMCLGHWYLMAPGLPVYHLQRQSRIFGVFVGLSALVFVVAVVSGWPRGSAQAHGTDAWLLSNGPFLALRLVLGLILPAVLYWRIDRFVGQRATQKATGLLYVALVFVLFGELVGAYLLVVTGVPV